MGGGVNLTNGHSDPIKVPDNDEFVKVIRCKDCKYWNDGDCFRIELTGPDDFCSFGER